MNDNPYFDAVETTYTQGEAIERFQFLLNEARKDNPYKDLDALREQVVSSLVYVSGYYDQRTRERVGQLFSHFSPYRR